MNQQERMNQKSSYENRMRTAEQNKQRINLEKLEENTKKYEQRKIKQNYVQKVIIFKLSKNNIQ